MFLYMKWFHTCFYFEIWEMQFSFLMGYYNRNGKNDNSFEILTWNLHYPKIQFYLHLLKFIWNFKKREFSVKYNEKVHEVSYRA